MAAPTLFRLANCTISSPTPRLMKLVSTINPKVAQKFSRTRRTLRSTASPTRVLSMTMAGVTK